MFFDCRRTFHGLETSVVLRRLAAVGGATGYLFGAVLREFRSQWRFCRWPFRFRTEALVKTNRRLTLCLRND
jgi:hypothetical protein